jgi:hypothetical protein
MFNCGGCQFEAEIIPQSRRADRRLRVALPPANVVGRVGVDGGNGGVRDAS